MARNAKVLPTSYTVFTAVGDYEAGEKLERSEYAAFLIDLYNEGADAETDLTPIDVEPLVDRVKGDTADAETLRIEAIEEASTSVAEEEEPTIEAARSAGFAFGARFDATSTSLFGKIADAKEFLDGSALAISFDMERLFITKDADGNVTRDETASFADPGSSWDDDDRLPDWKGARPNLPVDHYKEGKVRGSYFADMVDGSTYGKAIADVRACIAKCEGNDQLNDSESNLLRDVAGIKNWRSLHDGHYRLAVDKRWSNRRSNVILRVRRAVAFMRQRDRVESMDGMSVQFVTDDREALLTMNNVITLMHDNGKRGRDRKITPSAPMTLNKFNRLLVDDVSASDDGKSKARHGARYYVAQLKMAPIAALEKTVERPAGGRRKGQGAGLNIPVANLNGKQAYVMIAGLNTFFEEGRNDPKKLTDLTSELAGVNAKQDLLSLDDLVSELQVFLKPYEKVIADIRQDQHDQKQKETAERIAATGKAS